MSRLNIRKIFTGSENSGYCPSRNSDWLTGISPYQNLVNHSHNWFCSSHNLVSLDRNQSSQISSSQNLVTHSQILVISETSVNWFQQFLRQQSQQTGQENWNFLPFFSNLPTESIQHRNCRGNSTHRKASNVHLNSNHDKAQFIRQSST